MPMEVGNSEISLGVESANWWPSGNQAFPSPPGEGGSGWKMFVEFFDFLQVDQVFWFDPTTLQCYYQVRSPSQELRLIFKLGKKGHGFLQGFGFDIFEVFHSGAPHMEILSLGV